MISALKPRTKNKINRPNLTRKRPKKKNINKPKKIKAKKKALLTFNYVHSTTWQVKIWHLVSRTAVKV